VRRRRTRPGWGRMWRSRRRCSWSSLSGDEVLGGGGRVPRGWQRRLVRREATRPGVARSSRA
jgi:hypothetical protein